MNDVKKLYKLWTTDAYFGEACQQTLLAITDEGEISDRFYTNLEFGTAGMRGMIGMGTNRINPFVVRLAAKGLADAIAAEGEEAKKRGVAIAYDSRRMSPEFSLETALVLAENGIKSYLFESLRPTPELSFAIRHYNCIAGVNVTASHNPKEYNGYKVYWEDGSQISPEVANKIVTNMETLGTYKVAFMNEAEAREKGLIVSIGEECDKAFLEEIKKCMLLPDLCKDSGGELKIVYTPLHGAGRMMVERIFAETGFTNVFTVPEQANPDSDFSTVRSPNPESKEAFALARGYAKDRKADVILATDPDADRIGIYVMGKEGEYVGFNGNQIGSILLYYIAGMRKKNGNLPSDAVAVKSLATSDLANAVAKLFGIELRVTPVGFKYIGEQILQMEESKQGTFIFGFEESYGFLSGTYARDKDAVGAAVTLAEAALYYKKEEGKTLDRVLEEIFEKTGHFADEQLSYTLYGQEGKVKIEKIMSTLKKQGFKTLGGCAVESIEDFNTGTRTFLDDGSSEKLPYETMNIFKLNLFGGGFVIARPSGTEPKIKFYFSLRGETTAKLETFINMVQEEFLAPVKSLLE